jgi:hypothetical protein
MPSRRVITNGWVYWLAKHPAHGLILFDRFDQDGLSEGSLRVFELPGKSTLLLPQETLKLETTADVSDSDFVKLVNAYSEFKILLGKPLKAAGFDSGTIEDRHRRFLRERGLPDNGIRQATTRLQHRVTHCWSCKGGLDNSIDVECATCGWIICDCGACGCGR